MSCNTKKFILTTRLMTYPLPEKCQQFPWKKLQATMCGTEDEWNGSPQKIINTSWMGKSLQFTESLLFFIQIFWGHKSFSWSHGYPCFGLLVMSPLGFKSRVLCDPQIHLWCNACIPFRGQHDSQAFSIHILVDVSTRIGVMSDHSATSARRNRVL